MNQAGVRTSHVDGLAVRSYRNVIRLRDKAFSIWVKRSFRSFGSRSVIQLPARLSGTARIEIGEHVYIGGSSWLQTMRVIPEVEPRIRIGDRCSLQGNCTLSAVAGIELGDRVLLARGVYVSDHSHGFEDVDRAIVDQEVVGIAPVSIGEGAWLGQNVVVCPGVRIGRGAVIGANAVVTHDVPAFSVAVGVPAEVVRTFLPTESLAAG